MTEHQKIDRVVITDEAKALLTEIRGEYGDVLFQLSAGCCDGSGPMCFKTGDAYIGSNDVKIGTADGADIWASGSIATLWDRSQLILDVGQGSGNGFSLDNGRAQSFITRARILSDDECSTMGLSDA